MFRLCCFKIFISSIVFLWSISGQSAELRVIDVAQSNSVPSREFTLSGSWVFEVPESYSGLTSGGKTDQASSSTGSANRSLLKWSSPRVAYFQVKIDLPPDATIEKSTSAKLIRSANNIYLRMASLSENVLIKSSKGLQNWQLNLRFTESDLNANGCQPFHLKIKRIGSFLVGNESKPSAKLENPPVMVFCGFDSGKGFVTLSLMEGFSIVESSIFELAGKGERWSFFEVPSKMGGSTIGQFKISDQNRTFEFSLENDSNLNGEDSLSASVELTALTRKQGFSRDSTSEASQDFGLRLSAQSGRLLPRLFVQGELAMTLPVSSSGNRIANFELSTGPSVLLVNRRVQFFLSTLFLISNSRHSESEVFLESSGAALQVGLKFPVATKWSSVFRATKIVMTSGALVNQLNLDASLSRKMKVGESFFYVAKKQLEAQGSLNTKVQFSFLDFGLGLRY